jgi:hypothetical protein
VTVKLKKLGGWGCNTNDSRVTGPLDRSVARGGNETLWPETETRPRLSHFFPSNSMRSRCGNICSPDRDFEAKTIFLLTLLTNNNVYSLLLRTMVGDFIGAGRGGKHFPGFDLPGT